MAKIRKRRATLMKLVEPSFLSIVNKPANRAPFKIIRSAPEAATVQRQDGLLSIDFPLGLSQDEAEQIMGLLNLGDDYELATHDSGRFYLKRIGASDTELANAASIDMGSGFSASVLIPQTEEEAPEGMAGVQLTRLDFARSEFKLDQVKDWLEVNEIDFQLNGVECSEDVIAVARHDSNGEEHTVEIMPGIVAHVCRAQKNDVPEKIFRQVMEGALASFMDDLLNNLPEDVIKQIRSVDSQEIMQMPPEKKIDETKDEKIERQDAAAEQQAEEAAAAEAEGEKEEGAGDEAEQTITREDVEQIVKAAIEASLGQVAADITALKEEIATRADASTGVQQTEEDSSPSVKETVGAFGEMLKDITDRVERMSEAFSAMKGELEELAGTTVSRSDSDDASPGETEVRRSEEKDPFAGIFGRKLSY